MLLLTVELTGLRLFECHMSSGPQLDVRHSHTRPCSKLTQETLESDMTKHATKLLCFLQVCGTSENAIAVSNPHEVHRALGR